MCILFFLGGVVDWVKLVDSLVQGFYILSNCLSVLSVIELGVLKSLIIIVNSLCFLLVLSFSHNFILKHLYLKTSLSVNWG